jgi:hypothetical protein
MNELQFVNWTKDAKIMLLMTKCYSDKEIEYIIEWFITIKTRKEMNLLGCDIKAGKLFIALNGCDTSNLEYGHGHGLYHSLSARLFLYAPYLKKEFNSIQERKE